jgi:KDO2-lipid IV(A) lauroyltransferase
MANSGTETDARQALAPRAAALTEPGSRHLRRGVSKARLRLGHAWRYAVYGLEYGLLRLFIGAAGLVPLARAARLSGWLWRAIVPRLGRHRRADRHLAAMMPHLSAAERQGILRGMWDNLGRTFVEALFLRELAARPGCVALTADCVAALRRTRDAGGIIVAPHLGNWETAAIPLAAIGGRHAAVYRAPKNPFVARYLLAVRAPFYPGGLFEKGQGAALSVMRHVKSGGSVGIMADQRAQDGEMVPFFGRLCPSTIFPALLARQFRRPLFAVCVVRQPLQGFRMEIQEIDVPRTADKSRDIHATTAEIQRVFEGWIRQWPKQWMWAHRRYDWSR